MIGAVAIGLFSALMQSTAYILSRRFVFNFKSPWKLMIYSCIWMGMFGLLALAGLLIYVPVKSSVALWGWLAAFGAFVCLGNGSFFQALQDIEASRLSSLQGLKFLILTPLNTLFFQSYPGKWQYLAIALAMISAVGMNFTGGRLKLRGCLYLALALVCYAMTDISAAALTRAVGHSSVTLSALTATSMAFAAGAVFPLCWLAKNGFEKSCFKGAFGYAAVWFSAMVLLFTSFGTLGVMFGTIIQASRGMISVLLGVLLLKLGWDKLEPQVSAAAWVRRWIMAGVMLAAMWIYTWH